MNGSVAGSAPGFVVAFEALEDAPPSFAGIAGCSALTAPDTPTGLVRIMTDREQEPASAPASSNLRSRPDLSFRSFPFAEPRPRSPS